jgi:tRNA(Arg) A34 adenosine deaminase TadA
LNAFLIADESLFYAEAPALNRPGVSAVTQLIRGLWARDPRRALARLRGRIHVNHPLSPVCEGMIKVAAKRSVVLDESDWKREFDRFEGPRLRVNPSEETPAHLGTQAYSSPLPPREIPALLGELKARAPGPKPVAALLLGPDGRVLLGTWNGLDSDRTAHAELLLVAAWTSTHLGPPPAGSTVHVSLRPCAMCAAQILALAGRPERLRVVFHEEDPGPASKNSCLVPGSDLWRKAGAPAWGAQPWSPQDV